MALTTSSTPLKLLSSWKTCRISMTRDITATLSSRFIVSTIHLKTTNKHSYSFVSPRRKPIVDFLFDSLDSLLEPQCEVGGVADHAEQVRRVLLFVLSGPDAADQLGWPDSSVEERGFYFFRRAVWDTTKTTNQSKVRLSLNVCCRLSYKQTDASHRFKLTVWS